MFTVLGPHPRLRLYTRFDQYLVLAGRIATGRLNQGHEVAELESKMSERLGCRFMAAPMARTAIYVALRALIQPGQKVVLSPYTIAEVINMVIAAGGEPVFAELDPGTCNLSAESVENLLDSTDNIGAVMVTHFYGLICDVEKIGAACRRHGVPMIEDAAQAFGARIGDRHAGTFGDIGIYSFGLYKNINAFYGGGLAVRDPAVAAVIAEALAAMPRASVGRLSKRMVDGWMTDVVTFPPVFSAVFFRLFRYGILHDIAAIANRLKIDVNPSLQAEVPLEYFQQMAPAQAKLILSQLPNIEAMMAKRIAAARMYQDGLSGLHGLTLPPFHEDGRHAYWYYPLISDRREELVAEALRRGVDITASYHRNCADLDCFERWAVDRPIARSTAASVIYLPTYPSYPESEIRKNISVIRKILSEPAWETASASSCASQ